MFARLGQYSIKINNQWRICFFWQEGIADTDLRLSRALGPSEGFWLGLQADYDLEEKKASLKDKLEKINLLISFKIIAEYATDKC